MWSSCQNSCVAALHAVWQVIKSKHTNGMIMKTQIEDLILFQILEILVPDTEVPD
jgi:hypothetical protein